jgi:hypothetical protein
MQNNPQDPPADYSTLIRSLEAKLLAGLDSGPATPMTRRDWKRIKSQGLNRLKILKKRRT